MNNKLNYLEEKELIKLSRLNNLNARSELISKSYDFIEKNALKYITSEHYEEIFNACVLGFNRAIDKYQEKSFESFRDYANRWIKLAMGRTLNDLGLLNELKVSEGGSIYYKII